MRLNRLPFVALAICFACTCAKPVSRSPTSVHPTRVVGYFASWGVRSKGTRIARLPAEDLTHIFYAFAKIGNDGRVMLIDLSLIHISEPTRLGMISYAVFCLKKKKTT